MSAFAEEVIVGMLFSIDVFKKMIILEE